MPKRRRTTDRHDETEDVAVSDTSRKLQKLVDGEEIAIAQTPSNRQHVLHTPSTTRSILKYSTNVDGASDAELTPRSTRKVLFSANTKRSPVETPELSTPQHDHSARKKSKRLLQRMTNDEDDDENELGDAIDEAVARKILGDEESSEDEEDGENTPTDTVEVTPSKVGRPRGRPKGSKRQRTPSPPPDLPPHEQYFFQNRAGVHKTSTNTFASHLLLNHEDYVTRIKAVPENHKTDIKRLTQLHQRSYDQWLTELHEGFNLCLYGYGSKRDLAMDFAQYIHHQCIDPHKITVVNGYVPGLTIRDVLCTVAGILLPKNFKLPAQPGAILDLILLAFAENPGATSIYLVIHSLDHANLRKQAAQAILGKLASHDNIRLIATCDSPNFPLLWDVAMLSEYRFAFHDATTFQPYRVEIDVVDDVNALLGRGRRRLGGKDGVGFVLKSLPENARNLFRLLVTEQLAAAYDEPAHQAVQGSDDDMDDILGADDDDIAALEQDTPSRRGRRRKKPSEPAAAPRPTVSTRPEGVEYRALYHKAVEEFVCSSELNFRTLLKEFHDHQIIESRKDGLGTERLSVPFRKEELETLLEELV